MKNWFSNNLRKIIITAFVIPILLVAFVSISHVTTFYGISNPITWAIYLSVGIEIAALSALAAVSVNMGRFVYLPFIVVTIIQMLGNIFFSFTYIDETSQLFTDWINMVGGLFENMGIEKTDLNTHKSILSFLTGGLLPVISLTFAHMLVKFSENENNKKETQPVIDLEEVSKKIAKEEFVEDSKLKWNPTDEQIEMLEKILKGKYEGPEKEKVEEKPYVPSEDELKKFEEVLSKYDNGSDYDENLNTYQNIVNENQEPTEVQKKNHESDENINEDYKVLNYLGRND
jgi:hypothetical protein